MRLPRLFYFILLLGTIGAHAQDLKILVNQKGKVGYADSQGNEVIKCVYDYAQPFKEGVAIVSKSGKYGIIDATGNVLLPLKYKQITEWTDSLYMLSTGKKYGLATHQGKIVLPLKYTSITKPNCYGKAIITFGGKASATPDNKTYLTSAYRGIINAKGEVLIPARYANLYEFTDVKGNYFPFYEGKVLEAKKFCTTDTLSTDCKYIGYSASYISSVKSGLLDEKGTVIIKRGTYDVIMYPQNGMVRYYDIDGKKTICGYYDIENNKSLEVATFPGKIGDIKFWTHGDFTGDIAPVNGDSWSFIDKKGERLRSGYSLLKHDKNTALWAAKNASNKMEVFDEFNHNIESLSGFDDIIFPMNVYGKELFGVSKEGKFGCITRDGSSVIPMEYDSVTVKCFDVIGIKQKGKWGLIKEDNSIIIPSDYLNICQPDEPNATLFWVQKEDSLFYLFNTIKQEISKPGYKWAYNFKNGYSLVLPTEMKLDDTVSNRAQISTYTNTKFIGNISYFKQAFGYIINSDNEIMVDAPIYFFLKDHFIKEIIKSGGRPLTKTEIRKIMLSLTAKYRSYDIKTTLDDNEWDY